LPGLLAVPRSLALLPPLNKDPHKGSLIRYCLEIVAGLTIVVA